MPSELTPVSRPDPQIISGCNWIDPSAVGGASGHASGTVASASEAWARTTQTFFLNYVRVANMTKPAQLDAFGLVQVSACDNVYTTIMYNVATLFHETKKVYLPVGTSGYTQYQQLQLNSEKVDQNGTTYGEVSGFMMGPQGSITTTQPFVNQQKWDDTIHTVHTLKETGTSFGLLDTSGLKWHDGTDLTDPLAWYIQSRDFWRGLVAGGNPGGSTLHEPYKKRLVNVQAAQYQMYGAYNTSAEDAWEDDAAGRARLVNYIEDICTSFTSSTYYYRMVIPQPLLSDGQSYIGSDDRVEQNTYYNSGFHDYTFS